MVLCPALCAQAGGPFVSYNMASMSESTHCAKMQVLATLLRRWYDEGGNKVGTGSTHAQRGRCTSATRPS